MWELMTRFLQELAGDSLAGLYTLIAGVSFVCAFAIWILRKKVVSAHAWAKWFSCAFFAYVVTYALRALLLALGLKGWPLHLVGALGSGANNLFFLMAARSLRDRRPSLPPWAMIVLAVACLIRIWFSESYPFLFFRLPDAIFSSYCLGLMGYALATNISIRRQRGKRWVWVSYLVTGLYLIVDLIWAVTPLLNSYGPAEALKVFFRLPPGVNLVEFLDGVSITFLLPLKFGLFLAALVVLMRSILVVSSGTFNELLDKLASGRKEFIGSRGFLNLVGQAVGAGTVDLALRLPGQEQKRLILFKWTSESNQNAPVEPEIIPLPQAEESVLSHVLLAGKEVIWRNGEELVGGDFKRWLAAPEMAQILIAVPISFHGAIIGCLRVGAKRRRAFSATAVNHVRSLADLSSLAAQPVRELAAADQFSYRFARWRVAQPKIEIEEALAELLRILQDVFSPAAVVLDVAVGFKHYRKVAGDGEYAQLLRENPASDLAESFAAISTRSGKVMGVEEIELYVAQDDEGKKEFQLGKLGFVVPVEKDEKFAPTLGTNYLLRRVIGALTVDALLDIARDHFSFVLKDFAVKLNNIESIAQWIKQVQKAIERAGLCWAAATFPTEQDWLGNNTLTTKLRLQPPLTPLTKQFITPRQVKEPLEGAHMLLPLCLTNTNAQVWLGVERAGFGTELDFALPWRVFLERFSDIADTALFRLVGTLEMQRLQMETADAQGLASAAVTMETLFHQLVNLVRDIALPVRAINDALSARTLQTDTETAALIRNTRLSTDTLLDFAAEMMNVTKLDSHRPCSLREAAEQSLRLFGDGLRRNGIALEIQIEPGLVIDMPFHVAALAISNLVSNAKEVISTRGGKISIAAVDRGEAIFCEVVDDGPGVPEKVRDRIFEIGVTTKKRSGGWGLYLVKRSLTENHASIELTSPGPGGTKFTIRFPKPQPERRR